MFIDEEINRIEKMKERKIGEIFEYNGEWYQCVIGTNCHECDFSSNNITCDVYGELLCTCKGRSDETSVVFKKLEKIGEPYKLGEVLIQQYQGIAPVVLPEDSECSSIFRVISSINVIEIQIEQNKENMEEEREYSEEEFKNNPRFQHHKPIEQVINMKKVKPFDLQKAKDGKPVCTRDGRKARIICFDRINGDYYKIIACVTAFDGDFEEVLFYGIDGCIVDSQNPKDEDLMMLPEKREGWVNVYKDGLLGTRAYNTKKEAFDNASPCDYVDTVKISWEE